MYVYIYIYIYMICERNVYECMYMCRKEKYDLLSGELDKAKEREADLMDQFQVFVCVFVRVCRYMICVRRVY